MSKVRDAMVSDPVTLDAGDSARDAGERLSDPDIRAVLVTGNGGSLAGVVTRKTLVREVVAAGRDPSSTRLGEIAEPPIFTVEAEVDLEAAFHELEERDLERVPVVEGGRLVGILSRAVVQRRLAEDEPSTDESREDA